MKPILIYVSRETKEEVTLRKEELQKIIDQAYAQGREDAYKPYWYTGTTPYTITPTWTASPTEMTTSDGWKETISTKVTQKID